MNGRALTIAGSDSSGGAGIQADLKTFHRFEAFGTSVLTIITAQNTQGVSDLHFLPPELIVKQLDAVLDDVGTDAAKTGALGSPDIIRAVSNSLAARRLPNLVVDPVMISKHGDPLIGDDSVEVLRTELLPLASLVTPNLAEAAALTGRTLGSELDMMEAARAIRDMGPGAVVVKGGHRLGGEAVDIFYDGTQVVRLPAPLIETRNTHGTGCTFSAAITALLAQGVELVDAVQQAKAFLTRAIQSAPGLGSGYGPVNHWA